MCAVVCRLCAGLCVFVCSLVFPVFGLCAQQRNEQGQRLPSTVCAGELLGSSRSLCSVKTSRCWQGAPRRWSTKCVGSWGAHSQRFLSFGERLRRQQCSGAGKSSDIRRRRAPEGRSRLAPTLPLCTPLRAMCGRRASCSEACYIASVRPLAALFSLFSPLIYFLEVFRCVSTVCLVPRLGRPTVFRWCPDPPERSKHSRKSS